MKGFTLIETTIVIGLTVLITAAIGNFYINFNSVLGSDGGIMSVASGAGKIVNEAETMILPANQVLASYVFSGTTYTTSATTLVLELPAIDSSGNRITGKYDYAVFFVSGTTSYRIMQADSSSNRISGKKQLSTTVDTLTFAYDNVDFTKVKKVDIDVQTKVVIKGKAVIGHLHKQVYLRNH